MTGSTVLLDQLAFPKFPRWHADRLWFSDVHDGRVWAMTEQGQGEPVTAVEGWPAGLGWWPDGTLIVVSMNDRTLVAADRTGTTTPIAALDAFAAHPWNDMAVTTDGRAYIGEFGHDPLGDGAPDGARLVCVEPDGEAWVVAEDLLFPNGAAVLERADGVTLLVAETFGQRISAYDVQADGSLARPRVWADLRPNVPDGMCLDVEGALWVADPVNEGVMRVVESVGAVAWVPFPGRSPYGCALGGSDGHTLYVCTGASTNPARTITERRGRVEALRVEVPGVTRS
ncbi:SMP-30/gluconolactonase/LRE family protein [Rhabdothermincola salaria]|uniref:SMP-30/gluconolactonase/LRE family protein n=1 Tax=Rhabdothermincola salaria TaxID=2903142 RepID=UPI001E521107|nr:SMP-30/gluconolactonase/LRE family protein [Rhabdothermincola salaria]MCD9622356.1 SMP-30/gluconolactonase/LRE family protein [Rhabdothermincola salaria]